MIKLNKEWLKDNKVAINCKTKEEAEQLFKELIKLDIRWYSDYELSIYETRFEHYKKNTCFTLNGFNGLTFCSKQYFMLLNYTIINFSDLEFEGKNEENTPKITKTKNKEWGYEPLSEVEKSNKSTILRHDVKLNSGDIICTNDGNIGIVIGNCVSYTNGIWGYVTKAYTKLKWVIPSDSLKNDKGYVVGQLLFEGILEHSLKDLIIYVEDKPKKINTKIYKVSLSANGYKNSYYISDDNSIDIGDVVSINGGGLYYGAYGIVTDIKYKELTEEGLKGYSKIIKIK